MDFAKKHTWEQRNGKQILARGYLNNLPTPFDVSANGTNKLHLTVNGEIAKLIVDDIQVAELSVAEKMESGDVDIGTAFETGNEEEGKITKVDDFTVWEYK